MKAIRIHEFGGADVLKLEDVPRPEPAANEVLVRVYAAGVNPVDGKIRDGMMKDGMKLPITLGSDFAGVIEQVGDGVTEFAKGQAVYGSNSLGAYAEYLSVSINNLAIKPQTLNFIEAASVPVVAQTAWEGLFVRGKWMDGETVLIHGGAGGVGIFAVQFARHKGAGRIVATASSDDLEFVRELGADEVIDYQKTRFETVVRDVDVVLDLIGGETQEKSFEVLKPGGILIATSEPPSEEKAKEKGVRAEMFRMQPSSQLLSQLAEMFDRHDLKTEVGRVLPLEQARQAQEALEHERIRGKIVLEITR